jgi:hypothetical protein
MEAVFKQDREADKPGLFVPTIETQIPRRAVRLGIVFECRYNLRHYCGIIEFIIRVHYLPDISCCQAQSFIKGIVHALIRFRNKSTDLLP